jgi:hypothetical protein
MADDSTASNISFPASDRAAPTSVVSITPNRRMEEMDGTGKVDEDENELSSRAKRFLFAEINRLVEENRQLKQFKDKYHEADKKLAVLKEAIKPLRRNELLTSACLIAGSAGLSAAPNFVSLTSYGWYSLISISAMLLIAGILARFDGRSALSTVAEKRTGSSSK